MKKILLLCMLQLIILPTFAGGIGYINYDQIFENYKFAQNVAKEIQNKEQHIRDLIEFREGEYNKLETPIQKQKFEEAFKKELSTKEEEFNSFREKKEEEVYSKIHAITEKIRLENNYDAILDARSKVLNKLNEHQRWKKYQNF